LKHQHQIALFVFVTVCRQNNLLRKLVIDRPNQVWALDITYIPVQESN
jgi:hypothetical protein